MVKLSAREHFICHALLAEMYPKETFEWYKTNHAFMMMRCESSDQKSNRYFNSRLYELKRKDFSKVMSFSQSGLKNSQIGKIWIYNLELKQTLKIQKCDLNFYLENGFIIGRIINFDKKIQQKAQKDLKTQRITDLLNLNKILISERKLTELAKLFCVDPSIENVLFIRDILFDLYNNKQLTTIDIAKIYNTNDVTIRSWLILFEIPRRNRYLSRRLKSNRKIQNALARDGTQSF